MSQVLEMGYVPLERKLGRKTVRSLEYFPETEQHHPERFRR